MYHDFTWRDGRARHNGTGLDNPKPLESGMRRLFRVLSTILPVVALTACVSPTAPSPASTSCQSGKVPNAPCVNRDLINPLGDLINPLGDLINPLGSVAVTPDE